MAQRPQNSEIITRLCRLWCWKATDIREASVSSRKQRPIPVCVCVCVCLCVCVCVCVFVCVWVSVFLPLSNLWFGRHKRNGVWLQRAREREAQGDVPLNSDRHNVNTETKRVNVTLGTELVRRCLLLSYSHRDFLQVGVCLKASWYSERFMLLRVTMWRKHYSGVSTPSCLHVLFNSLHLSSLPATIKYRFLNYTTIQNSYGLRWISYLCWKWMQSITTLFSYLKFAYFLQ